MSRTGSRPAGRHLRRPYLLGLFVTAAALDRVPVAAATPDQHESLLRWEIDVILNGLAATGPDPG